MNAACFPIEYIEEWAGIILFSPNTKQMDSQRVYSVQYPTRQRKDPQCLHWCNPNERSMLVNIMLTDTNFLL